MKIFIAARVALAVLLSYVQVAASFVQRQTPRIDRVGTFRARHARYAPFRLAMSSDAGSDEKESQEPREQPKYTPPVTEPLQPFLPAADPSYSVRGPIGEDDFLISRLGGPSEEELGNENLLKILMIECSDLEVNTLVWKGLGYRFDAENEKWLNTECFPKWKEKYPDPPDFIGMQRIYSKEIDSPSLRANQALVRSIPADNKQSLKTHLKPYGFKGYKYAELTPNKTRRAQCANWLLYYREELFGYTIEELRERRRLKKEAEEAEKKRLEAEGGEKGDEWKPPVTEVF
uniref:Uncharacterized protein n=1 Tax=Pseudictyota dubia TaxID=2749911 RepID=A0A7R9Z984_9STRA|eukprot:CAMPEP_0197449078 /NCGR_PEP_ID=MMETSP1175-20131217/20126_1 /TAXON_ID=1003142 /ORGANISM="Triceratium dubium, Strain CCMP147" /LENGTH=288 /DNA_ID=CAMNT_0042981083 /DNA_START=149 /DNA_END=1015 /DNA_ORIENTATION=+